MVNLWCVLNFLKRIYKLILFRIGPFPIEHLYIPNSLQKQQWRELYSVTFDKHLLNLYSEEKNDNLKAQEVKAHHICSSNNNNNICAPIRMYT